MRDACKNCTARGDIVWCEGAECNQHDSWYAKQLTQELTATKAERDECQQSACDERGAKKRVIFLLQRVEQERDELANKYQELIMAVDRKYPNESRHETALKYIRRMEEPSTTAAKNSDG